MNMFNSFKVKINFEIHISFEILISFNNFKIMVMQCYQMNKDFDNNPSFHY